MKTEYSDTENINELFPILQTKKGRNNGFRNARSENEISSESTLEAYGDCWIKPLCQANWLCSANKVSKMLEFSDVNSQSAPIFGLKACS